MKQTIARIWEGQADGYEKAIALALRVFSFFYRMAVGLRNNLYDQGVLKVVKISRPVISVGNITVGGTGKTPMVIYLAKHFQQARLAPVVITRGYGGRRREKLTIVSDGQKIMAGHETVGEEAILLAESLPGVAVIVSPDKVRAAEAAVDHFRADLVILDDAFQHRRIFRDLDILLLDFFRPLGNGLVFPGGPMREAPEGLARADVIVFTANTGVSYPVALEEVASHTAEILSGKFFGRDKPSFTAVRKPVGLYRLGSSEMLSPAILYQKKVCLLSGIGMPEGFKKTVESLGAVIEDHRIYPDHHLYQQRDMDDLGEFFRKVQVDYVVTTEKDAIKLSLLRGWSEIYVLAIELEIIPVQVPQWEHLLSRFTARPHA